MHHDQLHGCHQRLQRELAKAYATEIWDSPRIHRLTRDLSEIDREIAALQHQEDDDDGAVGSTPAQRSHWLLSQRQRPVSLK